MKKNLQLIIALLLCAYPTFLCYAQQGGYALKFDGTDDYVNIPANASFDFTTGTIEAWIAPGASTQSKCFLSMRNSTITRWSAHINQSAGTIGIANQINYSAVSVGAITPGAWIHVAIQFISEIKSLIYVNGVYKGESGRGIYSANTGLPLIIGLNDTRFTNENFNGKIDEVRIWNTTRSADSIKANMHREIIKINSDLVAYYKMIDGTGTSLTDNSGKSNTGTLTNGPEWKASGCFGGSRQALDFDGVNDFVNIASYPPYNNNTLTIEAWIKTTDATGEKEIVGWGSVGSGGQAAEFRSLNGKLQFGVSVSDWRSVSGVTSINSGNWTHVAVVKSGTAVNLYVNGKLDASGTLITSEPAVGELQIGGLFWQGSQVPDKFFPGTIDEVRIWYAVRTETEIRENMTRTLDGNETGLVAYYRMDQQDGLTLYDITSNGYNGTLTDMDPATDWVASDAFNTWIGGESNTWSDATNWSNGAPSSAQSPGLYKWTLANVTTYEAAITGEPTVNNLLISSTSSPTISSGITVNANLLLEKNMNLNGQIVTLGSSATLVEGLGVFSGTTGMITTTRPLNNISAQNVAGLGAKITTTSDMGSTTINRKHASWPIAGQDGILRYYDINPTTNTGLNATLVFNYLEGELHGNTEANLNLYKTTNGGTSWTREKGTVNTADNTLTLSGIDSFSGWTASSSPKTIYVNKNASGNNDGTDWTDAYTSLQAALNNAVSSDQIWVAAGTYNPSVDETGNSSPSDPRKKCFQMKNGVAIYGGFAGTETAVAERTNYGPGQANETFLSGDLLGNDDFHYESGGYQGTTGADNCYHVFYHPPTMSPSLTNSAVLDGFTITGGNANGSNPFNIGGGICNYGNDATSHDPVISNCILNHNYGVESVLYIGDNCNGAKLIDLKIMENLASWGGAMATWESNPTVINSLFYHNKATSGGAIWCNGNVSNTPTFTNCTFTGNTATDGGAIYNGSLTSAAYKNCIIWGNSATTSGNQIYNANGGTVSLSYCDYSNGTGDVEGTISPSDCINANPVFVNETSNDYRIYNTSPCADAGLDSYNLESYDIRGTGYGRKLNKNTGATGTIDMGAYEYKYNIDPASVHVTATSVTTSGDYLTLKAAFDRINDGTHQGTVTVTINASTTESATAVLNASLGSLLAPGNGGAHYTSVYVYPSSSGLSVSGNLAAPLIDLNGADHVTIDGRVNMSGSADLIITNTSTSGTAGTSTIRFINDACNNTINYCTIRGSEMVPNSPTSGSGIIFFSAGASTGNDGNLIDNNNITNAADANRPISAIFSLGTSGMENSGNTISSNNIYDFLNRGYGSAGIILWNYSTYWTISGNSFYETATFTTISTELSRLYYAVYINSGVGHTISSNNIGGSEAGSTGMWTKTGNFMDNFMGIRVGSGSTGTASEIQGNIIRNISWSSSNAIFGGIEVAGSAAANIGGALTGNVIGAATGNGSISFIQDIDNSTLGFYGMYLSTTEFVRIQNNTVGAITTNNSKTGYPTNFYGIYSSGTGGRLINANTIGSTATETTNSIYASSPSTGASQSVYGIYNTGSGNVMIIANTVSKLTNGSTNTNTTDLGLINGITTTGGINDISGNTVRDLTIANANTSDNNTASVTGISLNYTTAATQSISGNTIYNLSNTYASFAGNVIGLYYNGSTMTSTVSRNFIHSLSVTGASSVIANIYGINIYNGATTWSNNIITLGDDSKSTIYGIAESNMNYSNNTTSWFNTVYIGGNPASGSNKSYACYIAYDYSAGGSKDIRNNIFVNKRSTVGGSSLHYAIYYWQGAKGPMSGVLYADYNDYFVSGIGGMLGFYNDSDRSTLPQLQAATGGDSHSLSIDPLFTQAGGTSANDYIPQNTSIAAMPGTGVLTDYANSTRSLTGPSMGAYEISLQPPVTVTASEGTPEGEYNTLKAAFDKINDGTHQGTVTVTINASTTEPASAVLYANGSVKAPGNGGTHYTSVYVYPSASGLSVTGDLAAPLIDLDGAENVTIDGRVNGGTCTVCTADLTISNISTSSTEGTSTIRFINDASDNTIQYCLVKGSATATPTTESGSGIIFFSSTDGTSGNDRNLIDHNQITASNDANRPLYAIFSNGTTSKENSDITISNNNIYNFLNRGSDSDGIFFSSNTTSCTISVNSFYETASFVPLADAEYYLIHIYNNGVNYTVSGNSLGGNSPACAGTWTKTNAFDSDIYSIFLMAGTGAASNIQGNIIQNFLWSNSGDKCNWLGITASGMVNIGTTTGNIIGSSTGTGSITYTAGADEGYFFGIYVAGEGTMNIRNNQIGSITMSGTVPETGHGFYGIFNLSAGTADISYNTIGSETTAGSINLTSLSTTGEQTAIGILNYGTESVTISHNHIANMTNGTTNSSTVSTGLIHGITTLAGSNTISGNIIRDLTIANANAAYNYQAPVIGIALYNTTAGAQSITGNTIYNLSNTNADFAGNVIGLYYNGSTTTSAVSGNFIHSLSVTSTCTTSANIYGIKIQNGATTWSNNIISVGSNYSANIYGIYENGDAGNVNNLYYNTVYISGDVGSTSSKSYALFSAVLTNTRDFRNNIFDNERRSAAKAPGVTLYSNYAVWFNYIDCKGCKSANLTLDYNDYYAPNNGGMLGYYNGSNINTLDDLKTVIGQDVHSQAIDPLYASAGSDLAEGYVASATTLVAAPGTGITTDYAGIVTRSATYPSMGAWEYPVTPPCANPTSGGAIAADQTICSGMQPDALTSITPPDGYVGTLEYKWQYSITSSSTGFMDIGTATATTYAPGTTTVTTWYKRVAKVTCMIDWTGAAESNVLTVTVRPQFTSGAIATTGETICYNTNPTTAIGSATAASGGDGAITYSWRSSADGYTNAISGATGSTYTPAGPFTATKSYRRYARDGSCNTTPTVSTGTWTVMVYGQLVAGTAAANQTICYGETPAALSATALTGGSGSPPDNGPLTPSLFTYQWQVQNGAGWLDIPGATAMTYAPGPLTATRVYRQKQTDTYCTPDQVVYTNEVTITVNSPGQVNQPDNQVVCNGASTSVIFTTTNTGGTTSYAWTNDNTSIGLGAQGTGHIGAFTATNPGTEPVVATIVVTPTFTNGGVSCTGTAKTFTITLNPSGQVNQPDPWMICNGSTTQAVMFTTENTGGTTTYTWTNDNSSIGLGAQGTGHIGAFIATNTGTEPVVATIVVTPTFTGGGVSCSGPTQSFTIRVSPTGQVDQPDVQILCNGSQTSVAFTTQNTGGTTAYSWTNDNTGIGLGAQGTGEIGAFIATNPGTEPIVATIEVTPTFTLGEPDKSYSDPGFIPDYDYQVVSCIGSTKTFTITVNPTGQVNQPDNQLLCNGSTTSAVSFGTISTGGTTAYAWTNDNTGIGLGAQGTEDIGAFIATNPGTEPVVATIVVTPTFSNGGTPCQGGTKTFTITVNPTGQVNQPASQLLCNGSTTNAVSFGTINTGGTTSYAWTNDNTSTGLGAQGTGDIAAFIATNPGTEPVVATIVVTPTFTNGGIPCQGGTKTLTITVNPTGQVNQPGNQIVCNNATTALVTFGTANTGGTTSYTWTNNTTSIGLGAQGTGDIGAFIATNPGAEPVVATIVVTPTFTNGGVSCNGPTKSFTITVNPSLPVGVSIEASANNRCAGSVIGYTATPVNAGINPLYQWKVNGNNVGSNNPLYVYIPLDGDVITCVLTVVNPEACFVGGTAISNAIEMTVYPHLEVGVSIASSANSVCAGAPVTVTATPVNGGSSPLYQWMVNGINAGANNPVYTYIPVNGDQITCKMTSNEQCVLANPATSNTLTMAVNPILPISVSIAASANPVCPGAPVSFTATPVNGGSNPVFQWKVNALNVGANHPVYEYVPANGDVITCMLTSNEVCMSGNPATSNAITLTVNPLPVPVLIGPITAVSGATGVVYNTQAGQLNYTWNISPGGTITAGGTTADPTSTVTWNTAGQQWISVNYTNTQTGCSGAVATLLDVTVTQASFISITSPDGGESWRLGSVHNITWNDNITGDVTIELFKDGAYDQTITASTPSTGTYAWTIARNQQPGDDYKVKIASMTDPALFSMSASVFTIIYDIPIDLEVRDIVIADGVNICFDALQTIFVAGGGHTFVVQTGGIANFIAGQNILYMPGTTVQPGGYMHGYITQNAEYCWSLPPSFVSTSVTAVSDTSPASRVPRHDSPVPRPVSRVPIPDSAWFRLYPNPTDGKFMVEYIGKDQPGTIQVEVFGMKGERILTKEMTEVRKQEFSLEGRAEGIYLVRIVADEGMKTVRVLKR